MMRRDLATVAMVLLPSAACTPSGPLAFEERDVADPDVQAALLLADRPGRDRQGFAPLPKAGRMSYVTPASGRIREPGWESVVLSLLIQQDGWSRAWYFGRAEGRLVFLCETETIHSRNLVTASRVGSGRPFYEYLEIEFATQDACDRRAGFRVRHVGSAGSVEMPLADGLALARSWFAGRPLPR